MDKQWEEKQVLRYSLSFQQMIVQEIEDKGVKINEVARKYGIKGGQTIQNWIRKFGKDHLLNKVVRIEMKGEKDRVKELEKEVKRLKLALADSTLANRAMETLIELVNEHYQTDVKKNLGSKQSKEQEHE